MVGGAVRWTGRIIATIVGLWLTAAAGAAERPEWLPRYDLGIHLDDVNHVVTVQQRVTWTNRHATPTTQLVFNAYPRYRIPPKDLVLLAKTFELLRAAPSEGIDSSGRSLHVHRVTLGDNEQNLAFHWRDDIQTALVVQLPKPVMQGEQVTIEIAFTLELPEAQGRWGHWKGTTFLANWHPVLAYYDDDGWQPTPFVAWHQPFFNEAGIYNVRLTVPKTHKVASTGSAEGEEDVGGGYKRLHVGAIAARDFAIVASPRFQEYVNQVEGTRVRVLAFPEHEHVARKALEFACEVIPIYNRWFGHYPYPDFEIVESHFPWNGNECSGLVMIDERVFAMPSVAEIYVDHLISHETLHQWWYNVVGTNGYRETWMDEGLVCFFTARRLQLKYGKNAKMLQYPRGLHWAPNVRHEDYRLNGLYGTLARGEEAPTVGPLEQFGHLVTMFSMVYDRGAKILGMIEERMGTDAFFDFMRLTYARYQFRILRVADFQRELEAYTGQPWGEFFQTWLYAAGMADWAVEDVRLTEEAGPPDRGDVGSVYQVVVTVRQKGQATEPTTLGVKFDREGEYVLRVPVYPSAEPVATTDPHVTMATHLDGSIQITLLLPQRPAQISIDPDQVQPDREPANNHWKHEIDWRFTPLYTNAEETDLTNPYDRWAVIMGPWVGYNDPAFGQIGYAGVRAGAFRLQQFRGGVYTAYDFDDQDLRVGADALFFHCPWPSNQFGIQFDHSITPDWADRRLDRGRIIGRHVFHYTPSFYLDQMEFVEVYGRVQNQYWVDHLTTKPGLERYDDAFGVGVRYDRFYYVPYWDPEAGYRLWGRVEYGFPILGGDESYRFVEGQFAFVKGLPAGLGYLSSTRVAARVYGGLNLPDNGEMFQLGGATRVRGLDRASRQGSALWIGSLEWRFPLARYVDRDCADHSIRLKHVYGALFYDGGAIYVNGQVVDGVAHSLGAGIRCDFALFSFMERILLRLDVAKVVNADDSLQFWFGIQQAF